MIPSSSRLDRVAHAQVTEQPPVAQRRQGLAQVPDTKEYVSELYDCSCLSDIYSAISSIYQKCVQWVSNLFGWFFVTDRGVVENVKNQFMNFINNIIMHDRFRDLNQLGAMNIKGLMVFKLDDRIIGFNCGPIAIEDVEAFLHSSFDRLNQILDDAVINEGEELSFDFFAVAEDADHQKSNIYPFHLNRTQEKRF